MHDAAAPSSLHTSLPTSSTGSTRTGSPPSPPSSLSSSSSSFSYPVQHRNTTQFLRPFPAPLDKDKRAVSFVLPFTLGRRRTFRRPLSRGERLVDEDSLQIQLTRGKERKRQGRDRAKSWGKRFGACSIRGSDAKDSQHSLPLTSHWLCCSPSRCTPLEKKENLALRASPLLRPALSPAFFASYSCFSLRSTTTGSDLLLFHTH
jgi:hypothetical protein